MQWSDESETRRRVGYGFPDIFGFFGGSRLLVPSSEFLTERFRRVKCARRRSKICEWRNQRVSAGSFVVDRSEHTRSRGGAGRVEMVLESGGERGERVSANEAGGACEAVRGSLGRRRPTRRNRGCGEIDEETGGVAKKSPGELARVGIT